MPVKNEETTATRQAMPAKKEDLIAMRQATPVKEDITMTRQAVQNAIQQGLARGKEYHERASTYDNKNDLGSARHEIDKTIQEYGKVIQLDPKYVDAYVLRGCAHVYRMGLFMRAGEIVGNERELERSRDAIRQDCNKLIDLGQKGNADFLSKALNDIDNAIQEAVLRLPKRELLEGLKRGMDYHDRAHTYATQKDLWAARREINKGIKEYDKVVQLDPEYSQTYGLRGHSYFLSALICMELRDINGFRDSLIAIEQDQLKLQALGQEEDAKELLLKYQHLLRGMANHRW